MPRQPRHRDTLLPHRQLHADVIKQNSTPAHQHSRGSQIHQPVKHRQRVVVQGQEREKHKDCEQCDTHIWCTPARRAQEDLGCLTLEGKAVEDARSGQQALVAAAPCAGDDNGVDQAGDTPDTGGGGGDDKGGLRGGAALVAQARVVACDEHADDEDGEHVEEQHADEHLLARAGDGLSGILSLGGRHGDGLDARKGEDGRGHDAPEAEKLAPVAGGNVLDKGAWILPVIEADSGCSRDATEVDDKA